MNLRYEAIKGSQSSHCCFDATVVDKKKPSGYNDEFDTVCECFDFEDAQKIADALNKAEDSYE